MSRPTDSDDILYRIDRLERSLNRTLDAMADTLKATKEHQESIINVFKERERMITTITKGIFDDDFDLKDL